MRQALKYFRWIATFFVVGACVDKAEFPTTDPAEIIVVDGAITDDPGPYTVRIFRGLKIQSDSVTSPPVTGAKVVLHSDLGESEPFVEVNPGEYQTGGVIRGLVGSSYYITMTMADGSTFESEPDPILPTGHIEEIRYSFEARTVEKPFGTDKADVFNIYIDSETGSLAPGSYVRWRFTGVYKISTTPELHTSVLQGYTYMTPWACSGYEVDPALNGGILRQHRPCTCCVCYATAYENEPRLSDGDAVSNGQFNNLKVAEVPITRSTFYEKYKVQIEQMTISKNAFDFFKIIRVQKQGVTNIFQPPPGKLTGNIKRVNADYDIIGLFWGASITKKSMYIDRKAVPYDLPRDFLPFPCTSYLNSVATKPVDWDE